jgi:predicted ferric reductase
MLVLVPFLALFFDPVPPGRGFWREISVGLGFAALSMMGMQFLLTGRFKYLTSPYGIDVVYHFHRQISLVTFLFVLLHPVILFISSPVTLRLLNPLSAPWRALAGMAAVLALVFLIVTSLWRLRLRISYETWLLIHGILAIAAVAFAVAHIEGVGYYVRGPLKRGIWIALLTSWIFALLYVRIIKPLLMLRRPYRIDHVKEERGNTWTLVLQPQGHGGMMFRAGQFAWLKIGRSPFSLRQHPFSFSSSAMRPERPEFTIKELGDFTSRIGTLEPGTTVYVDGAHGMFTIDRHRAPGYVFIAGGIGITPVMSMLRTLADRRDSRPLFLFYSGKDWEDFTFREELEGLTDSLQLRLVHVPGKPPAGWKGEKGRINADMLARYLPVERADFVYFVCGPEGMQMAVRQALDNLGLPLDHVHSESFNFV